MKKNGILNAELSRIVASMGHTDKLVVCDAGLPIPIGRVVVDLALTSNIPRFMDALSIVLEELQVERAFVATEMVEVNGELYRKVKQVMGDTAMTSVPHEQFKELTNGDGNVFFLRTGEATPYANIILVSGVTF